MNDYDRFQVEQALHQTLSCFEGLEFRWNSSFWSVAADAKSFQRDVNCFLRTQLGSLSVPTFDVRLCLDDQMEIKDWLRDLKRYVFPLLLQNNLPVPPQELVVWPNQPLCV